jgi:hypothetical protein
MSDESVAHGYDWLVALRVTVCMRVQRLAYVRLAVPASDALGAPRHRDYIHVGTVAVRGVRGAVS